jgi:DNA-directed RNA polymerase specialized sigma24 family protein
MSLDDVEPDLIPRLKNVLKELTKPLRQVLILHAEGYSDSQIAVMTKTKLGTVRSRLHYARKRARCYLGKVG